METSARFGSSKGQCVTTLTRPVSRECHGHKWQQIHSFFGILNLYEDKQHWTNLRKLPSFVTVFVHILNSLKLGH